jgi:hypothetical protein
VLRGALVVVGVVGGLELGDLDPGTLGQPRHQLL